MSLSSGAPVRHQIVAYHATITVILDGYVHNGIIFKKYGPLIPPDHKPHQKPLFFLNEVAQIPLRPKGCNCWTKVISKTSNFLGNFQVFIKRSDIAWGDRAASVFVQTTDTWLVKKKAIEKVSLLGLCCIYFCWRYLTWSLNLGLVSQDTIY